jgi:hypothetical protein
MKFVPNSVSRVAVAAGAVLVLGGSAVGIASAQTTPTPTPNAQQQGYQKFIDALAQRLGISSQQLQSDISQARQDAGLPASGGFGGGRGGPGSPRGGFRPFVNLQTAAQAIGITPQQLLSELPGKSVAQVATSHGKQPGDVVNALTAAANTRIDRAVASGRITADQGNTQKADAANRVTQEVNRVTQQGGPGAARTPGAPGTPGAPSGPGRGPGGPGAFGFGIVQQGLNVAAQAIGITPQQLRSELAGTTLTAVAQSHQKNPADVATALKNAAHTRIDQAVANGRLTADQGNTQKTNIDARIDQLMMQTIPQAPVRRGPGGGQQGGSGS